MEFKTIRCILCRTEFDREATMLAKISDCPKCKTKTLPEFTDYDVTVKTNWQELQILVSWSNYFSELVVDEDAQFGIKILLGAIVKQLNKSKPDDAPELVTTNEKHNSKYVLN